MNRHFTLFVLAFLSLIASKTSKTYACNQYPEANIKDCPKYVCVAETVQFDGSGSFDPDGYITEYDWDFPPEANDISGTSVEEPNCVFDSAGIYKVRLQVKDNEGASSNWATCRVFVATDPNRVHNITQDLWYSHIQLAINDANEFDELEVQQGTCYEYVDFDGKDLILRSPDPNDWGIVSATIVDANNMGTVITFDGTESSDCKLLGLTITGGNNTSYGGGIYGAHTEATVSKCIIRNNTAQSHGGGLQSVSGMIYRCMVFENIAGSNGGGLAGCKGTIINCLVYGNSGGYGGGLNNCDADISNCTVVANTATIAGGGLRNCDGTCTITNCIIWDNEPDQILNSSTPSYSCIEDWIGGGTGNISGNPEFVDPANDDYHLYDVISPCIDTGDPNSDYSLEPFSDDPNINSAINMGAYGNTPEAALIVSGLPFSRSFESYQGFDGLGLSIDGLDGWKVRNLDGAKDPNAVAVLTEGSYWTTEGGSPASYSYQYLSIEEDSVLSRTFADTGQNNSYIRLSFIPAPGLRVSIMNGSDKVASVYFDKDEIDDSNSIEVLDNGDYDDTGLEYLHITDQCRNYLVNTDPNLDYTYEDTWVEVQFHLDWSNNVYDVNWCNWETDGLETIITGAEFNADYDGFTGIKFEQTSLSKDPNSSTDPNTLFNRISVSDESEAGGVIGTGEDVYITYPQPTIEEPLQGRCYLIGSVWYDKLGVYKIKCCSVDSNPDDLDEETKEFVEYEEGDNWATVYTGYGIAEDGFVGEWDTSVLYNGSYYLKIELYNDLGLLYSEAIVTKEVEYNETTDEVNVQYPVTGRLKAQTFHYEDKPNISINWPGQFPFELKRIYNNSLRKYPVPFWYGWTHNQNIKLTENCHADWATDSSGLPDADEEGLGIGRLWLQEGLGSRMFIGYVNPGNNEQVIYEPLDNQADYIIRESTVNEGTDFDASYIHYATDGTMMIFDCTGVSLDYAPPASGEGVVKWQVPIGIDEKKDRFGNALQYTWYQDPNNPSYCDLYITRIENNCTSARIDFENYEQDGKVIPIYSKAMLKDGSQILMYVEYSFEQEATPHYYGFYYECFDTIYAVTKSSDSDSCTWRYYYRKPEEGTDQDRLLLSMTGEDLSGKSPLKPSLTKFDLGYEEKESLRGDDWHTEPGYNDDGLLKWKLDYEWIGGHPSCMPTFLKYNHQYDDSGNLITTETLGHFPVPRTATTPTKDRRSIITIQNSDGAILSRENTTQTTADFDRHDYDIDNMQVQATCVTAFAGSFPGFVDYGGYIGGGGFTDYSYLYEDGGFPLLPTTIYEDFDDDGDSDYDRSQRKTTRAYDSRGNLIEQKVFVDSTDYVATVWEYHPLYNFPTKKTTWQGYCYDDTNGDIVSSGAKVETQWIYGDEDGTADPCGIYLVQQKVLLDEDTSDWGVTDYTYYKVTDVSSEPNEFGLVETKTDPNGNITFYEYDDYGFISKVWEGATLAGGYPQGNPQKRYCHDELGRKLLEANTLGRVNYYLYDGFNNVTEKRKYTDYTALGRETFEPGVYDDYDSREQFVYAYDKLLQETTAHGAEIEYYYWNEQPTDPEEIHIGDEHQDGWYMKDNSPIHIKRHYEGGYHEVGFYMYDSMDRLVDKYVGDYTGLYYPLEGICRHEHITYYGSGQKKSETIYKAEYDFGESEYIYETEKKTTYYYDELDRLIQQVTDANSIYDPLAEPLIVDYGYDAVGNRIYVIDPNESVIFTDYDSANRKTKEYFAQPAVYDEGQIDIDATKLNATVKKEIQYYDHNKVKQATSYDYDGSTILSQTDFEYDSRGRIEKVTQWISDTDDAVTSYAYADCNDVVPTDFEFDINDDPCFYMFNIIVTDAEDKVTKIGLNPDGKRNSIEYPSDDYELIHYYGHGLPASKSVFDSGNDPCWIEYEYDNFGKLAKKIFPDDDYIEFGYGPRVIGEYGLLTSVTDCRNSQDRINDPNYFTFEYDVFDRIKSYTNRYTIDYKYRAADNQKTEIKVTDPCSNIIYRVNYLYDKAGRLISITDPNAYAYVADFGYSPNGARTMLKYYPVGNPDNPLATISYDYNADNFLKSFTTAGATFSFDANSIDGLGRLVSADETLIDPNGDPVTHSLAYSYDGLGQLLSASMTNINSYTWSADYDYNRDGNIDSKTVNSDTTDFAYTGDLMTDIGDDELTWDYNGQLTESVIASLEYNWSGKLRSATAGSDSISLKYDPMGNRVYKSSTVDSVTTNQRFIVDIVGKLPIILCVIDADDGSLERSYIYAGAQPIAFYEGDYTDPAYIYLHDRLGSVRQVLDESGNVKNTYTYTPFGTDPNSQFAETVDNPFKFTGQWYDSEIAQYYLRARMYDPQLMRFTAIDPVKGKPHQPLTLHAYLYCLNDPVNRIDLTGKIAISLYAEQLIAHAILAELRVSNSKFMGSVFDRAKGWSLSFSQMNLERGMMYDIVVQNINRDIETTLVDAGTAYLPNAASGNYDRWTDYLREIWEDREEWDSEEWRDGKRPEFKKFLESSQEEFLESYGEFLTL